VALVSQEEINALRSRGVFVREKCDKCSRIIMSSVSYTTAGKKGVYCSAACRDLVILGLKADSVIKKNKCHRCHGAKEPGGLYCSRCLTFADPHYVQVEKDDYCNNCGTKIPLLKKSSGAKSCSSACARKARNKQKAKKPSKTESEERFSVPGFD